MQSNLAPTLLSILLPCAILNAATWNDSGTNFNSAGSWSGGSPDSASLAIFPADATISNQPALTSSISILGLSFEGAGYTLSSSETGVALTIGNGGITSTGAGTNTISANLTTGASSTAQWEIGAANSLVLSGTITAGTSSTITKTGSGTLVLNSPSGSLASSLKISEGTVLALTPQVANALEISNGARLDIGFAGTNPAMTIPIVLGEGGAVISLANAAATRIDSYFSGSGDLELRGNPPATRYFQIHSTSSRASTNTGKTTIAYGTVRVSGSYAIGDTSVVSVNSGAELQIRNSETVGGLSGSGTISSAGAANFISFGGSETDETFSGVLRDDPASAAYKLSIVKIGTGTQTFSGSNSYTGNTTIQAGTLLVTNYIGSGTVTVQAAAELGGTGRVAGPIIVNSGGKLLGGSETSAIGTLTLDGDVTFETGSLIKMALGPTSGNHGTLAGTGGAWSFDEDQAFSFVDLGATVGTYEGIITGLTGAVDVSGWTISSASNPGWTGSFSYNAGTSGIDFTLTSVPEPSVIGLALLGTLGACWIGRRNLRS